MLIDRRHMVPGTLFFSHSHTRTHTQNDRKVGSGIAVLLGGLAF